MPIKKENRHLYGKDWQTLSRQIRERDNQRCRFCGIENHSYIWRWKKNGKMEGWVKVRIVLTVAHLDHTAGHNDPSNLVSLCQNCHIHYDVDQHKQNAAQTRANKTK